jgi:hypothetical protein
MLATQATPDGFRRDAERAAQARHAEIGDLHQPGGEHARQVEAEEAGITRRRGNTAQSVTTAIN